MRLQDDLIERLCTPECCSESRKLESLKWDENPTTMRSGSGCTVCRATFDSPQAALLPDAAKVARFYFVVPEHAGIQKPWESSPSPGDQAKAPNGIVLLLPSTGEQGSDGRLQLAERLARESGYCSLVLTASMGLATRRAANALRPHGRPVSSSGTAIIEEAALLCWCADRPGVPLCVWATRGAAP